MRNIPVAFQTHLDGEVLSITRCFRLTRKDGVVVRLTTHDVDLVVNGDTYYAGVPLEFSAIESTDTLAVDNAEVTVGIDGTIITEAHLNEGLYDAVEFELFLVNWEDLGDGIVYLKRGTLGDIEVTSGLSAKMQLRGLTQALQRPIVEKYSPTCRVALGGKKCGVVNTPTRLRRPNQKVKTFDWYLVPAANNTPVTITNSGFESTVITTGWVIPTGSSWSKSNALSPYSGSFYAESGSGSVGDEHVIFQDFSTSSLGLSNATVDAGDYSFDFDSQIMGTSSTYSNTVKLYIEQYNSLGVTIQRTESEIYTPEYNAWQGVGVTAFVLPTCRTIRIGFVNRIIEGSSGYVALDSVRAQTFTNVMSTWGSKQFRTMKIPAYASSERLANLSFETDGAVSNTNVSANITGLSFSTSDYWRVISSSGALSPYSGSYFLAAGNNGSGVQQEYAAYVEEPMLSSATAANVSDGWYYAEVQAMVAQLDVDSTAKLVIQCLNSAHTVIDSYSTGYFTPALESWVRYRAGIRVPAGTAYLRGYIYAKSPVGDSYAKIAFDVLRVHCFPTAYEHDSDAEYGNLSRTEPTYDYTTNAYTIDGGAIVQARSPVFSYGTVSAVTDKRVFSASSITETAELFYSGKITWLSGNNAGRTSYVRIWDNTTKVIKLYDALPNTIQAGDKFVYAKGCDKTIGRCADTFGNAHNFRGEPYLPGPSKVIEYLTATTEVS